MEVIDEEPEKRKDSIDPESRRLLLSKQLYLHGVEHSNNMDALGRMIAVHNFHNAVEITLRAIASKYGIDKGKGPINEFERLWNAVDEYPPFKEKKLLLPLRDEVMTLNKLRNLVQDQAMEPPASTMEDLRVFTRRFLQKVFRTYFETDYDELSALYYIRDEKLRQLLASSLALISESNPRKSVALAKLAFEYASDAVQPFLPKEEIERLHGDAEYLQPIVDHIYEKSRWAQKYAVLLWTGISPVDYKRFESGTSHFSFGHNGHLFSDAYFHPDDKEARWIHTFVVGTIVHWQSLGLDPKLSPWQEQYIDNVIKAE